MHALRASAARAGSWAELCAAVRADGPAALGASSARLLLLPHGSSAGTDDDDGGGGGARVAAWDDAHGWHWLREGGDAARAVRSRTLVQRDTGGDGEGTARAYLPLVGRGHTRATFGLLEIVSPARFEGDAALVSGAHACAVCVCVFVCVWVCECVCMCMCA